MTLTASESLKDAKAVSLLDLPGKLFVDGIAFASLNKNCTIEEYEREVAKGEYYTERVRVTHVVDLTSAEYLEFERNLMTGYEWLSDLGGHNSTADVDADEFWKLSEEEMDLWRKHAYALVLAVRAPGRRTLYINPEGYNYARYVGFEN